jgi:hypothetical protein
MLALKIIISIYLLLGFLIGLNTVRKYDVSFPLMIIFVATFTWGYEFIRAIKARNGNKK